MSDAVERMVQEAMNRHDWSYARGPAAESAKEVGEEVAREVAKDCAAMARKWRDASHEEFASYHDCEAIARAIEERYGLTEERDE